MSVYGIVNLVYMFLLKILIIDPDKNTFWDNIALGKHNFWA